MLAIETSPIHTEKLLSGTQLSVSYDCPECGTKFGLAWNENLDAEKVLESVSAKRVLADHLVKKHPGKLSDQIRSHPGFGLVPEGQLASAHISLSLPS